MLCSTAYVPATRLDPALFRPAPGRSRRKAGTWRAGHAIAPPPLSPPGASITFGTTQNNW
jgi:hypothetical protein